MVTKVKCPTCQTELEWGPQSPFRPFCSKRCADIDLHRWLSGGYRVETDEAPGESGAEER